MKLRAHRRPILFSLLSVGLLLLHYVLRRAMAHGHVAHALLGSGPSARDASLAVALIAVRFITVMFVPGLLFAAAAEFVAYLLVGPPKDR